MEVGIYRNIKGKFQAKSFKLWKSYAHSQKFIIDEHATKSTHTITVYQKKAKTAAATFIIFHSKPDPLLCLDYLRIEPADPQLFNLIDSLIEGMRLSGEKHIINESYRTSTIFTEGKAMNLDHFYDHSKLELLIQRETIFGCVHLSLDRMIEFQRSGNDERAASIKNTLSDYQKMLKKLNEQINAL